MFKNIEKVWDFRKNAELRIFLKLRMASLGKCKTAGKSELLPLKENEYIAKNTTTKIKKFKITIFFYKMK